MEMSLVAGDMYIITDDKISNDWIRVMPNGHYVSGMAPLSYLATYDSINKFPYFIDIVSRNVALDKLKKCQTGNFSYLLRPGNKENRFIMSGNFHMLISNI